MLMLHCSGQAKDNEVEHHGKSVSFSSHCASLQVSEKFLNGHSNDWLEVVGVSTQKSPAPQLAKAALLMAAED